MTKQLLVNKIICPDGTELESRHKHDFVLHVQEDGREYFIDGGLEYQRIGCADREYIDCTCYVGDDHGKIREHFTWESFLDADGNNLDRSIFRKLKDITDDHLEALIRFTEEDYPDYIHNLFIEERKYRDEVEA